MTNNSSHNYYTVLGVEPNASAAEIKTMYHKLAKKYHADANSSDPTLAKWSHDKMVELNEAYGTLGHENKRTQYDNHLEGANHGQQGEPDYGGTVLINSFEEGKVILLDGVRHFHTGAPTIELESAAKEEMERLVKKKTKRYLKMGVPNAYPVQYLQFALENIAVEAIDNIQERVIHNNILWIYIAINLLMGAIAALLYSNGFFLGIWDLIVFVFVSILQFQFFAWVARFIAHGVKSNLVGERGFYVNGSIALILVILSASGIFF